MSNNQKTPDFASQMKQLEDIIDWFESDDIDLDQAVKKFEAGMKLSQELQTKLKKIENKVEKIKTDFGK